jgi:3-phenylpropionate/trans-cinnamate dioxygenase alpha subunit
MDGFQVATPQGHGLGGFDTLIDRSLSPRATDWMAGFTERLVERVGHPIGSRTPVHGTIFPNFSLLWSRWTIRVWHPKGPDQMDCWSWGVVPRSAPPMVRRELVLAYQQHFSPAGTWEQDDGEQWAFSARDEGFVSSTVPLNYQMGANRPARSIAGLPGQGDSIFSEIGQRAFYRRWSELMATPHHRERTSGEQSAELADVMEVRA